MDFDTNDSLNPETDELLQQDGPLAPVTVEVRGSVRTHQLPARVANSRFVSVTDAAGGPDSMEMLAAEDPRREYMTIIVTGQPLIIGHVKQEVFQGVAGVLPVGIPLTLRTSAPIWAKCATAGQSSAVSYWTGEWAD